MGRPLHRRTAPARVRRALAATCAGALAAAVLFGAVAPAGATPTDPVDPTATAPRPASDSIEAAAAELNTLQTTAKRLLREHDDLVASQAADQAETVTVTADLAATRVRRKARVVRTYVDSFTGNGLDEIINPSVGGDRLRTLADAADRADDTRIRTLTARLGALADHLHQTEAALATNLGDQTDNQARLDTVTAKFSESATVVGPGGAGSAADPGPSPLARAARDAETALVARDVANASAAAAGTASQAAPGNPDVAGVAADTFAAAATANTAYDAARTKLAALVSTEAGPAASAFDAAWSATPTPAMRATYFGLSQFGKDYVYATEGPNQYDCSGLTRRAWQENGISLPHFSGAQLHAGTPVAAADVRPGDLLAYGPDGSEHVVLAIGAGFDVEAKGAKWGVVIERADTDASGGRYAGAARPMP